MPPAQSELARNVLAVLIVGALIGGSLWILRPFLGAVIWATMIVVATWPMLESIETAFGGRRWAAVVTMTLILLLLFVIPFSAAIGTIVANIDAIVSGTKALTEFKVSDLPEWLATIPIVGERASQLWRQVASQGLETLATKAAPYAGGLAKWFVAQVGNFGVVFVQILLTVVISAILFAHGETAGKWVSRFGIRLAGPRGDAMVRLSAQAIRGVALGVVVTALVQALLGGLGLLIAGVPFVAILTALMFMLAVAQIGAVPVLAAAIVWLYWIDAFAWGTFLLVVAVVVGTLDNILRPILIKKGADLPLLLIFAGVIGGLIAFGLIGIFIGPMVLAVTYTLANAWVHDAVAIPAANVSGAATAKKKTRKS